MFIPTMFSTNNSTYKFVCPISTRKSSKSSSKRVGSRSYPVVGKGRMGSALHPVSITRFPLSRFSPGAGLLRIHFFTLSTLRFSRGWVRKDGNLVMETGCNGVAAIRMLFDGR